MKNRKGLLYSSVALMAVAGAGVALADLSYTQGSGTTIFDFVCFTSKHCSAHTNINSSGSEIFTSASPGFFSVSTSTGAQGTIGVTQSGSWAITTTPSSVPGAAQSGSWTVGLSSGTQTIGTVLFSTASTFGTTTAPVNVNVTNANTNGATTKSNSSPVVLPTDYDPCSQGYRKTNVSFASTGQNISLVSGVANNKIYVCSMSILTSSGTNINLVEGINASCTATSTTLAAVIGSTAASKGLAITDNGGMTYGSGSGTVAATAYSSTYLCLTQSSSGALAGNISVVQTSL